MSQITPQQFQDKVLSWYDSHGRKDLPWQQPRTPYTVWLSEIMLQQTQVATVIPYFERFIERFATVEALAAAELDEVLHLWSGLGYYSRARNLHRAAKQIVELGQFPDTLEQLVTLPGIGRSTAGAIISQAFNRRAAILDGNVKRLLVRFYAIEGWPGERNIEKQLWQLTETLAPEQRAADYTQAVMDLGAMICSRSQPNCSECPLQQACLSYRHGRQSELPHKKPRKQLPLRSTVMVIVRNSHGQILLQRRPPSGIWGGLWSLPQYDDGDVVDFCRQQLHLHVKPVSELTPFRHTFSHFHLDIHPVIVESQENSHLVGEDSEMCWYDSDEFAQLGLPQPVKRLLHSDALLA